MYGSMPDHSAFSSASAAPPPSRTLHLTLDTGRTPPRVSLSLQRREDSAMPSTPSLINVDVAAPRLPYADALCDAIVALDVLEHVLDEEHWLAELARITRRGGQFIVRVPSFGPLAWLDALNLYRYLVEMSHRGTEPKKTLSIGWHRHYGQSELSALLLAAGFRPVSIQRTGTGLAEAPSLAGLISLDWALGLPNAERRISRVRAPLDRLDQRLRVGPLSTAITIEAVRV